MNIQHPTSNIERPIDVVRRVHWMLDVGCWMLDVPKKNRPLLLWSICFLLLLSCPWASPAQDKPEEKPKAEEKKSEEKKTEEKKEEEKPTINFEGPEHTGPNWVVFSVGGMFTSGNDAQAQQMRQLRGPAFGGIEDLHFQTEVATNTTFTVDGRSIFDEHDYRLTLGLRKEDVYYLRLNFENFRTYYNGDGGFFPPANLEYSRSGDALELDRGEISFEAGTLFKDKPNFTFKYSHLYRDGDKSSTIWGQTHPALMFPSVGLTPSIYDIDETRDIFQLDAKHHYKLTDFGAGVRYEIADLNNALKISQYPGEPPVGPAAQDRKITDRQDVSYDLFSAHAFSETWFKPDLMFSSGFMYTSMRSDFSGDRIYGSDFDVNYVPNPGNGAGYNNLKGFSHDNEYVLNANLLSIPLKTLTVVPSIRVQRKDWGASSQSELTLSGTTTGPFGSDADGDSLDVRERIDARFSGITNWVLYASTEWTEGRGNLEEDGGIYLGSPILRETDTTRFFQKYGLGAKWYPLRKLSLDFGGYYKNNNYDYDHDVDNTPNNGGDAYPAFLVMQNFDTYDGYTRLTFRPLHNLTLVTRYEFQYSTVHTKPDSVTGLGEAESAKITSHILAQNVSWSPWSRLYLQLGFNYVLSETETPAADFTQAVLDAQNNYWTLNFNSGFVLDNKTDLNLGYTYYRADNYENNSAFGVPYGAGAEQHGVNVTLSRWLSAKVRLNLRYGFYHYVDDTFGGNYNYDAHVVYSSLEYRF